MQGRYLFPYAIGAAVNLQVQSGWPWSRLMSAKLPNAGTVTFFQEDINNNRSVTAALLGIRVDKSIDIKWSKVMFMVDVLNLLNSNAVVNSNVSNGARFSQINGTLDPRTVQVGIRFQF